ncbi:glutamate-5-semialdehyde dehydrogenase [Lachnospiraceae bacterium PAL113]|uniref:Gamma-glutamyl phosphate reductase n=2 Tax=Aequitasia blattaphilus TaxID=2949332 RepID=A0ABT1EBQ3_9FIRM|nr:glutamate-5-semialdehyde dehydrogenase [Aequitasia blattaphilus]MCR8614916.1 glutamate-5-semialdehyde dehydrogenase [Aequitasia blattaphilus]
MSYMQVIGKKAKEASGLISVLGQEVKNKALEEVAQALIEDTKGILDGNKRDLENAKASGMKASLLDRMLLNEERIGAMAEGLRDIAKLKDPIGEFERVEVRPNGLRIGKKKVALGVVGMIYESRPNVTSDAFGLCFKTGNVAILRGSKDIIYSNQAIVAAIKKGLERASVSTDAVLLVEDLSYDTIDEMMSLREYIDVLIPRGGAGLIKRVTENSSVPVIETGTGNCHLYIDEYADEEKAVAIVVNAKTQRLGVCNACESLVVHKTLLETILPKVCQKLEEKGVEIRGDESVKKAWENTVSATEKDWGEEYLDSVISIKTVDSIEDAIYHINRYNTGHSEGIITEHYNNADLFQERIDAAAVYVNASTRFTDGFEFGYGAEIGISTQKLHVRGPMGLDALTTTKYVIFGNGQIRD